MGRGLDRCANPEISVVERDRPNERSVRLWWDPGRSQGPRVGFGPTNRAPGLFLTVEALWWGGKAAWICGGGADNIYARVSPTGKGRYEGRMENRKLHFGLR